MAYTSVYKAIGKRKINICILVSIIANKPLDGLILASIGQNKQLLCTSFSTSYTEEKPKIPIVRE